MSISKGKMRLDRPISQIHNWGLDPRYLSNSLCTEAPPPLRKYQGERRLWIAVVNRVLVNIYVNYSVCFPSDSWKGVDRPTPLLLFLFSPVPPFPLFPLLFLFPFSFCSPDPPILYFPLFPFSLVTLFPPFLLLPLFLLFSSFPCFLFPLFLVFPCSLVSPVSLFSLFPFFCSCRCFPVPLVPLFPLFPCVCFLIKPLILLWIVCQKQANFFKVPVLL